MPDCKAMVYGELDFFNSTLNGLVKVIYRVPFERQAELKNGHCVKAKFCAAILEDDDSTFRQFGPMRVQNIKVINAADPEFNASILRSCLRTHSNAATETRKKTKMLVDR